MIVLAYAVCSYRQGGDVLVCASAPTGRFALSNGTPHAGYKGGSGRPGSRAGAYPCRSCSSGRAGVASIRGAAPAPRCSTAAVSRRGDGYVDPLPYPSSSIRCLRLRRMGAGRFSGCRKPAREILSRLREGAERTIYTQLSLHIDNTYAIISAYQRCGELRSRICH